ncbi:MAG: hypothetical protein ACYTF7_00480 [Planctomycetota bacterium]|jgi:predicted  nucleic acid-binding Zn-ribbon protein
MAKAGSQNKYYVWMAFTSVLALVMFVVAVMSYGRREAAVTELATVESDIASVYPQGVRNTPNVSYFRGAASNQPLVGYLADSMANTMRRVTGSDQTTYEQLTAMLEGTQNDTGETTTGLLASGDATPLVDIISNQRQRIDSLQVQLNDSDAFLADAQEQLAAKTQELDDLRADQDAQLARLEGKIDQSVSDVQEYRASLTTTLDENSSRVEEIRRNAAETEDALNGRIAELEQEQLLLQSIVEELRSERSDTLLNAENEYALADGRVIGTQSSTDEVFVNLGRDNRLVVGMTFEVYDDTTAIRPDAEGAYPLGKAAIEVIRINQGSSTCRVIRSNSRNPVVEGDIIANALYDPDKVYRFVVYGNFDTNRDEQATSQEAQNIVGIISDWGGLVENEMSGNTDFLVLGERPVLPPEPSADSPLPVIQNYIRQKRSVEEYDRLFRVASQTSIPVLNQNRLYTMTGLTGDR